jgi:hypothetical protein
MASLTRDPRPYLKKGVSGVILGGSWAAFYLGFIAAAISVVT